MKNNHRAKSNKALKKVHIAKSNIAIQDFSIEVLD